MAPETQNSRAQAELSAGALEMLYRQFSCPQEAKNGLDTLAQTITSTHAREFTRLFVAKYGEEVGKCSTGLVEMIEDWLTKDADFETIWDIAFGNLYRLMTGVEGDPVGVAVGLAMRISGAGISGEWTASLKEAARLRWGHRLLPAGQYIEMRSDADTVCMQLCVEGHSQTATFTRVDGGWHGEGAEILARARCGQKWITLLPRHAQAAELFPEASDAVTDSIEPYMVSTFEAATETLARHAPDYLSWVERVIRNLFVLRPQQGSLRSGSSSDRPGLVYSSVAHPVANAEILVHESSHQHLHLVSRMGPLDDGTDRKLYYSPPVGEERSLSRIVVAYHAFANVLLLYRTLLSSGLSDDGYCVENQEALLSQLRILEAPLRGNPALTAIGRALCEPLMERLQALGLSQPRGVH